MMQDINFSPEHVFGPLSLTIDTLLPKLPQAFVILGVGYILVRVVSKLLRVFLGYSKMNKGLRQVIVSIVDTLLLVFLGITVLQSLQLDNIALTLTAITAGLGLALGNGLLPVMQDILAGVFLANDKHFAVGDHIIAGEEPVEGIVEAMDMRRTRIRDTEGRLHVIPNSVLERKAWVLINKKHDRGLARESASTVSAKLLTPNKTDSKQQIG